MRIASIPRLAAATGLAALAACSTGFHFEQHPYSELIRFELLLSHASDLDAGVDVGGQSFDWIQGPSGFNAQMRFPAEVELREGADPADYAADVYAYLREDVFGNGFHLVEEDCALELREPGSSTPQRATIRLAWTSATGKGSLQASITDGPRTGVYDVHTTIDESEL